MKTKPLLLFMVIVISLLPACHKERPPVTIAAYKAYVEHPGNGLIQSQRYGELKYHLRYLPIAYQALKGFDPDKDAPFVFNKNIDELKGHHYFLLQLQSAERGGSLQKIYEAGMHKMNWLQVVHEMDFSFKEKFQLHLDDATLPCRLYHAFKGVNTSGEQYFLLIFKDAAMDTSVLFESDLKLEFDDQYFAGRPMVFHFKKELLNQVPKLKSFEIYEN
ncbi:MAG: hypothetical protein AAF990_13485 [Bacteroidota bacterium]